MKTLIWEVILVNVLLYEWNELGIKDLKYEINQLGIKVESFRYFIMDYLKDDVLEKAISEKVKAKKYDFFISFNFFPVISDACDKLGVKYVSWVWDSPLLHLYFRAVHNPCNYIFLFDKEQYLELVRMGVSNVYHMPLAVSTDRIDRVKLSAEDKSSYSHDISFVGSLYDKGNHYDEIRDLSQYLKGYFDGIMRAQMNIYGYNFLEHMLDDNIMKEFLNHVYFNLDTSFIGDIRSLVADRFLSVKVTEMERRQALTILAEHFKVFLYSSSVYLPDKIVNKGLVDYYDGMVKVFKSSKINLNITLRSIKSGIPLRIFDILGAGGFLITNYQSEIPDYFDIGQDLVCYESMDDLVEKTQYYLTHENERKEIAENGYAKVKKYHNYQVRLKSILEVILESYG